jgi:hypothetical protein
MSLIDMWNLNENPNEFKIILNDKEITVFIIDIYNIQVIDDNIIYDFVDLYNISQKYKDIKKIEKL